MTNKQLFFTPHPLLRAVVNNIMIGRSVADATHTNLSFQFPPLPEHSIIFYPLDKPTTEDVFTKQIRTLYATFKYKFG
jgi:hypothetical protein